ncbi:MAG: hypothetical protein ACM31C_20130 [Acidobacteriota bacterium]
MPVEEYVVGFECELSRVPDVAVQEAVERFAEHLRHDNEHNRAMEHLVDLLGTWAGSASAAAAMDGEAGAYVRVLEEGRLRTLRLDDAGVRARFARLREGGIRVINPAAAISPDDDPMIAGRPRQRLAAIDAARKPDLPRLLRALAHPANARGAKDAAELRRRIYTKLTMIGGSAAEDALIGALATEDNEVIDPVISCFVRQPTLLARLPDVLAAAWRDKRELVARRVLELAGDLEWTPGWRAHAPRDLVAEIDRRLASAR